MPRNQVFRLVDNAGRAVRIVAWGDNNVEHPAIEDKQEVLLFYALARASRNSGEKNDDSDSDGGLWLFTSYILGMGASEEVPPFITKSQKSELPTPYAASETRKNPLTFHYTGCW